MSDHRQDTGREVDLVTFTVAGRRFGVPIADVREITGGNDVEPVPHAPTAVRGYVNIRGHIHLTLDLRELLGYPREEEADRLSDRRMVVFKEHCGPFFGLLIDRVDDIVTVAESRIVDRRGREGDGGEAAVERRTTRADLVRGVIALTEGGLLLVLRAESLLNPLTEAA